MPNYIGNINSQKQQIELDREYPGVAPTPPSTGVQGTPLRPDQTRRKPNGEPLTEAEYQAMLKALRNRKV